MVYCRSEDNEHTQSVWNAPYFDLIELLVAKLGRRSGIHNGPMDEPPQTIEDLLGNLPRLGCPATPTLAPSFSQRKCGILAPRAETMLEIACQLKVEPALPLAESEVRSATFFRSGVDLH